MLTFEGHCDAACSGNPGPGAAAAILVAREGGKVVKEIERVSPVEPVTTNQRQELLGGVMVLEALSRDGVTLTIQSDSKYLVDGMTSWVKGWQRRGWVNAKGEPVANRDLWQRLIELERKHHVTWRWVKGHAGDEYNERCDRLAVAAVAAFKKGGAGGAPAQRGGDRPSGRQ